MAKKITKEPNIKRYKAKCPICECDQLHSRLRLHENEEVG